MKLRPPKWLYDKLGLITVRRKPDFIIGGPENPYMRRWFLIPRNRFFNIYLHVFCRSDDDRALHDHPWLNLSWLISGTYVEHTIVAGGIHRQTRRRAGDLKVRRARAAHRIELTDGPCWTLFITGPKVRHWGFHCPEAGWVYWKDFVAASDHGAIGKGCDQ